ncbi:hypothetical protein SCUP515_01918 [Seiridium cupressi]
MASTVSFAFLQLFNTPWLSDIPTSRDVVFVRSNDFITYDQAFITKDDPHLMKKIADPETDQDSPICSTDREPRIQNHTLLALGVLLIEIMLQRPFDVLMGEITPWNVESIPNARFDIEAARKLAVRVGNDFGHTFGSAIQRYVDCNFNCKYPDLHDESFRQEFYSSVVALLEENVKHAGLE